jgi:hypothetical protein
MARYRSWTDEQLIEAVSKCFSYRSVIKSVGLIPAGGNYVQIKSKIEELNLSTSHFTGERWALEGPGLVRIDKVSIAY